MSWSIHTGDCLDYLRTLPSGSVDAVVTDPPYGMGLDYSRVNNRGTVRTRRTIEGDTDTSIRDAAMAAVSARATVCFGTWKTARPAGVHSVLVWDKGVHVGMGDLLLPWKLTHEEVYLCGDKRAFSGYRDGSVLRFPALYPNLPAANAARGEDFEHPTQKPIALMVHLIDKLPPGCTILDPFCGSGTTGVACIQTGRNFIGCEIEPKYAAIARRRCADAAPLFVPPPRAPQPSMFDERTAPCTPAS